MSVCILCFWQQTVDSMRLFRLAAAGPAKPMQEATHVSQEVDGRPQLLVAAAAQDARHTRVEAIKGDEARLCVLRVCSVLLICCVCARGCCACVCVHVCAYKGPGPRCTRFDHDEVKSKRPRLLPRSICSHQHRQDVEAAADDGGVGAEEAHQVVATKRERVLCFV